MKKIAILVLISLSLLLLNHLSLMNWFKGGLGLIMGWRSKIYSSLVSHDNQQSLEEKFSICQAELVELKNENQQSRRLLGAKTKPETQFELAKIISVSNQELILALESAENIQPKSSVVSGPFLIGKITSVFGRTAKVELLTSSSLKVPVKIWPDQNTSNLGNEVIGEGILTSDGQNLYVEEILDNQNIKVGNWVGALIESGDIFWIGKVEEVFPSEDKVFKQVKISWSVDLSKLMTVGVVK